MLAGSKSILVFNFLQPYCSTDWADNLLAIICVAVFLALLRIPNFHILRFNPSSITSHSLLIVVLADFFLLRELLGLNRIHPWKISLEIDMLGQYGRGHQRY
jgi:hypothetical protein